MVRRALAALIAGSALSATASECNVRPQSLLGAWVGIGDRGFFEQMSFESQRDRRTFVSWRHDRPEIAGGSWDVVGCTLTIRDASGNAQTFLVGLRSGMLTMTRPDGRVETKYRRTKTQR